MRPIGYELLQENTDIILCEDDTYLMWDGTWEFDDSDSGIGTEAIESQGTKLNVPGFKMLKISRDKYTIEIR